MGHKYEVSVWKSDGVHYSYKTVYYGNNLLKTVAVMFKLRKEPFVRLVRR